MKLALVFFTGLFIIQESSRTKLTANMILNIDIWLSTSDYGIRCEDGVLITENKPEWLSNTSNKIHTI